MTKDLRERRWRSLVWAWAVRDVQVSLDNPQPSHPTWNCTGEMPNQQREGSEIKSCSKALSAAWCRWTEWWLSWILFLTLPNYLFLIASSFYWFFHGTLSSMVLILLVVQSHSVGRTVWSCCLKKVGSHPIPQHCSFWDWTWKTADISWAFLVTTSWKCMLKSSRFLITHFAVAHWAWCMLSREKVQGVPTNRARANTL